MVRRLGEFQLLPACGTVLLFLCCGLPLGWLVLQIAADPTTLRLLAPSAIRWDILGRTCGYSAIAAGVALVLALPAAWTLGHRRGPVARLIAFALPLTLLLPSLTYAYGWAQYFRLLAEPLGRVLQSLGLRPQHLATVGITLRTSGPDAPVAFLIPAGPADVLRCIFSIAAWLWPVPAAAMAMSLRRADPLVFQQALLDGAARRIRVRQMLAPGLIGLLAVWLLAGQEFAVYEPTGISVVATEVRQVFETGSFSTGSKSMTQPMGGMFTGSGETSTNGTAIADPGDAQQHAAAAAVATAVPMLLLTAIVGSLVVLFCRRTSIAGDEVSEHVPTQERGGGESGLAIAVLLITVGVPVCSMLYRHHRPWRTLFIWQEFGDLILGSLWIAFLAGIAGAFLALAGLQRRVGWRLLLALATFLTGGQLLAIALIRLYNRPTMGWIYHAEPIMVMAYIGRFGWLALLGAASTWTRPWRTLRAQASIDGASPQAALWHVVLPLAWPVMAASALLILVLSLTEVPATVLAAPFHPPQIVPMLMTWVHTLESDPMIEASLMLALAVMVLGSGVHLIARFARKPLRLALVRSMLVGVLLTGAFAGGCGKSGEPDDIWLTTGTSPGQVVYPRALCYSDSDDSFFVIDRVARVQHLDRNGKVLNGWQMPDWQFGKPVGVTVGPDGNVYIPDTHYHRVMVYTKAGELLRQWGALGKEHGQFIYPTDVAFDGLGHVFVSEYGENDRIQVFDAAGKWLYQFGQFGEGDGAFSRPQSMLIRDGLVYVTDSCNHRIAVFRTDGSFVRNMGTCGSGLGQFRFPYGLDVNADGQLVVCEFGNNRVQLVDAQTGKGIKTWGVAGREPGQLAYPWGVAVDKKGRVVAVDAGNNRLQVFRF